MNCHNLIEIIVSNVSYKALKWVGLHELIEGHCGKGPEVVLLMFIVSYEDIYVFTYLIYILAADIFTSRAQTCNHISVGVWRETYIKT